MLGRDTYGPTVSWQGYSLVRLGSARHGLFPHLKSHLVCSAESEWGETRDAICRSWFLFDFIWNRNSTFFVFPSKLHLFVNIGCKKLISPTRFKVCCFWCCEVEAFQRLIGLTISVDALLGTPVQIQNGSTMETVYGRYHSSLWISCLPRSFSHFRLSWHHSCDITTKRFMIGEMEILDYHLTRVLQQHCRRIMVKWHDGGGRTKYFITT